MHNVRLWIPAGLALMLCLVTACDKQRAGHQHDEDGEAPQVARTTEDGAAPATPAEVVAMTPCEKAIQNIRDRDFHAWHGLPAGCDWTPLTGSLPTDWQEVPGRPLGNSFRDAKMIMLALEGYSRPSLSFVDGQAVLFEAMGPRKGDRRWVLERAGKGDQPEKVTDIGCWAHGFGAPGTHSKELTGKNS